METKENEIIEKSLGGFELLKEYFPVFESEDKLPEAVRNSAKEKGTELLYEYLIYENNRLANENGELNDRLGAFTETLGNQRDCSGSSNPLSEEFMRSLWG